MEIVVSPQLLAEYREVPVSLLTDKKIDDEQFKALIAGIAAFVSKASIFYSTKKFDICRDSEDNMLLECCYAARADYLITGDKDLLAINTLPFQLKIISPRNFLAYQR
jgi:putative PIN family toxin of toxin-antitoxin system